MPTSSVKQELLKLLQSLLRGELNRNRRRKNRSPWMIGGLAVAVAAVSYFLHEPKAPSRFGSINLRVMDQDRYGRTVAQVFAGERDIGLEMVRQGRAVVYEQYNDSPVYRQVQTEAKRDRRGIWEKPGSQQDPASWRRLNPR